MDLPDSITFLEDESVLQDFGAYIDDIDEDALTLTASGNENVFVSIELLEVTLSSVEHWNGTETVIFTVDDSQGRAVASDSIDVIVTPVNDIPEITGQVDLTTPEEISLEITLSDLLVTDVDNNYPDEFTLTVTDGNNYTFDELVIIPDTDFVGTLSVPVFVDDGVDASNIFELSITVTPVNDAPTMDLPDSITFLEDESVLQDFGAYIDDIDEDALTLTASGNENVFVSIELLEVTLSSVEHWNGTETVIFTVDDSQGRAVASDSIDVIVTPVNDIPEITGQVDLTTPEEISLEITLSDLLVTDVDNNYPDEFTLTVTDGNNYTFDELVIIPDTDFVGTLSVPVFVDDGEAVDSLSNIFNLIVEVTPVNDAPEHW
jgi:hypothetical protein